MAIRQILDSGKAVDRVQLQRLLAERGYETDERTFRRDQTEMEQAGFIRISVEKKEFKEAATLKEGGS